MQYDVIFYSQAHFTLHLYKRNGVPYATAFVIPEARIGKIQLGGRLEKKKKKKGGKKPGGKGVVNRYNTKVVRT